jgi:hypothetical protein
MLRIEDAIHCKMFVKFKRWLYQMVALLIVWTILLAVTGWLDKLCNTMSQFFIIAWLCVGIGIMLLKKIDFPLPQADRVDVPGAFKMLWWAAFWPYYLIKM